MKKILQLIFLLCFYINTFSQQPATVKIEALNDYINKADHPLIINFWATWCKPCVAEIPYIQQAAEKYKDSGVELIMVSLDFPETYPNEVTDFIKAGNMHGTFFWLNETDADYFCPVIDTAWQGSIPATLFLNNKTRYRKFFERKITENELNTSIQEMLR